MSGLKTFTVAGAGNLGKFVIEALLKLQKEGKVTSVSFLSRQDNGNDALVANGAKRVVVDYSSPSSLSSALSGTDVVVSTLGGTPEAFASQSILAKAAKEAGVQIFVPSEFGTPTDGTDNPFLAKKNDFKDKELRELGLPFVAFYTGPFTDFLLAPPVAGAFGFDIAGGKIDIKGVGKAPVSFTTREDIASYLAYVLTSLPKKDLEWRAFKIEGDRISLNEIADIVTNQLGKKAEVTHTPREVLEEALKKNPADFRSFLLWLWDTDGGLVGTPEQLDNKEYPEWKPKKVAAVLTELYA